MMEQPHRTISKEEIRVVSKEEIRVVSKLPLTL